ncbi:hypothetical protein AT302_07025 [Pandoraea norimbergensis]|uniref:Heptosyltransferase n=1 Tax=Pandoraea norimbergensis TaxID=93219 RepID=A0ABN4JGI8_9BURK|nr:hypothetical protein AT302_07025 [Pandoraea norimbergensis]
MVVLTSQNKTANVALVSLKAFGDLVIARAALRQAGSAADDVQMFIGEHLIELHEALSPRAGTRVIEHGPGVPAFFDVKKAGAVSAMCSGVKLRKSLRTLTAASDTTLVFDRLGARERFLAGRAPSMALPASQNIYRAYMQLLGTAASAPSVTTSANAVATPCLGDRPPLVGIFPGSRIAAKQLPPDLIAWIAHKCRAAGADVEVFCLEGEPLAPQSPVYKTTVVPRRFSAMLQAVGSVDRVVSADSMPAHLAEFVARPVFVASPVTNTYWLPLSSLEHDRWALFGELALLEARLNAFVGHTSVPVPA